MWGVGAREVKRGAGFCLYATLCGELENRSIAIISHVDNTIKSVVIRH